MIGFIFSLLLGWLGLGLIISLACGLAYFLLPEVPWVTHRLRQLLLIVCICSGTATFVYAKGVYDGTTLYKAKIEREIKDAIAKGNVAKEKALRDFDASPDNPDDGFSRD